MAEYLHVTDGAPAGGRPCVTRVPAGALAALLPVLARADSALGCEAPVLLRVVRGDGTTWSRWLTGVEVDWRSGVVTLVAEDGESAGEPVAPLPPDAWRAGDVHECPVSSHEHTAGPTCVVYAVHHGDRWYRP